MAIGALDAWIPRGTGIVFIHDCLSVIQEEEGVPNPGGKIMIRSDNPQTGHAADEIRAKLKSSLPSRWSFLEDDLGYGINVLKVSLNDFFDNGGEWQDVASWVLALSGAIAQQSVALSVPAEDIPSGGEVKRHAFFLAAVLICNACHGDVHHGRPCSNIKVGQFGEDAEPIRDLFRRIYQYSGLPIG
jgi:hypothetical protein